MRQNQEQNQMGSETKKKKKTKLWPKITLDTDFVKDLEFAFGLFDGQGLGLADDRSIHVVLRALDQKFNFNELKRIRRKYTIEVDGKIVYDYHNFFIAVKSKLLEIESKETIANLFELMDNGDKGYIDLSDIKIAAQLLNQKLTDEELEEMISMVSPNGCVNITMFEYLMKINSPNDIKAIDYDDD